MLDGEQFASLRCGLKAQEPQTKEAKVPSFLSYKYCCFSFFLFPLSSCPPSYDSFDFGVVNFVGVIIRT